jgi:hypothetical protein
MSLLPHLDSLIPILAGAVLTTAAFRRKPHAGAWAVRALRILGPALMLAGGAWLFAKEPPSLRWERFAVDRDRASAEFPGAPAAQDVEDGAGGADVARTSLVYAVPGMEMSLRLSASQLPVQAVSATEAERIASALAYFAQQGFTLQSRSEKRTRAATLHRLNLRWEAKRVSMQVLVGYSRGQVYRAMATFADGHAEERISERFLGSFRIAPPTEEMEEEPEAEPTAGSGVASAAQGTKTMQTGAPTATLWPVGVSLPVAASMRKATMLSVP